MGRWGLCHRVVKVLSGFCSVAVAAAAFLERVAGTRHRAYARVSELVCAGERHRVYAAVSELVCRRAYARVLERVCATYAPVSETCSALRT
jgi:hypothetical protein